MTAAVAFVRPLLLALFAPAITGCGSCPRQGCEALNVAAAEQGPAVSGSIASSSDVVIDGCSECRFGSATVQIWPIESAPSSDNEAIGITNRALPTFETSTNGTYSQALNPGTYLLCVRPNCIAIEVGSQTVTVNAKRREGPTSFFVATSGSDFAPEDFGFTVGILGIAAKTL